MDKKFALSESIIGTYKCCLCKHLLSVPPVMSAGLEEELYKCGRCEQVKCQTYTRNRLFENVAQHLSFPCSYPQCNKNIPWGRVDQHERNCPQRTIKCPIYYHNCSEGMQVDKLENHFKIKHPKNIKSSGVIWDVNTELDYVFLIEENGQHFFVYILHLDEIFSIAVLSLESSKYTKFSMKILPSSDDKFALSFDDMSVVRYDERLHCYMCIRKKCREPHHPYSENNKTAEMNLSNFTSKLRRELIRNVRSPTGEIRYCIKLVAEESVEVPKSSEEEKEVEERAEGSYMSVRIPHQLNVEALKKGLSCPYCMTYMAAPIFTCPTGHTICNVCRPRLNKCPTCVAPLGNCRNYTLEEMAKDVGVPCMYDVKGCTFVGNASKMYIHELECSFNNLLRE